MKKYELLKTYMKIILIIALLFITSCREKPPKLKSGQAVKVTEGFYENCEGIVISYTYDVFSPKYPDVQYYVVKINKHCPTALVGFYYEILQTVKQEP